MNMIIGKRQIIIATLVVALGLAVYLNWYFAKSDNVLDTTKQLQSGETLGEAQYVNASTQENDENTQSGGDTQTVKINEEYFTEAKLNRQQAHDEALEILNAVINNSSASEEAKKAASEGVANLAANLETESDIENLVKAKGFQECVTIIQEDKAQVIVPSNGLLASEITQIKEIVINAAKINSENITIIEAK